MDAPENLRALFGRRITPFIGSGMVRDAGVVDAGQLARAVAAAARVDDFGGDLTKVIRAAEAAYEQSVVQQMVREIVLAEPPRSTPALRALASCARGWFILTTNYDDAIEVSVMAAGLKPVPILLPEVWTAGSPAPDEVFVVHIHGRAVGGGPLILPGRTTNVEAGETRYVAPVTQLLVQEPVVYFGFSFGDGETALQSAVAFMDTNVAGAAEQVLVIRSSDPTEAARRFSHLPNFSVATYYESHEQASWWAQNLSGRAEAPDGCLEKTSTSPPPAWLQPRMFAAALDASPDELEQLVFGVDHRYGTPPASSLEARELFEARHALLIASPGMGKSELCAHLAREDGALPVLVLKASVIAAELDPARSSAQVFAAALLRGAWASRDGVPRPTLEALRSGPLGILVDGFDEVRQGRGSVAGVIAEATLEWPQHHIVVASRPVPECRDLIADGFAPYRLWPSNGWATEYLNARGVDNDARTKMEQARGFEDLIAIPLFARLVADRLLSGELPARPLDLLVDAQRVAAAREEEREVVDGSLF
ncbi:MAG: hypothetical protein JWM71_1097, partial [Solirubrobacteraceae bacterium]|nr:hypothetical protein [Solirubrobacteraceae bacterium]